MYQIRLWAGDESARLKFTVHRLQSCSLSKRSETGLARQFSVNLQIDAKFEQQMFALFVETFTFCSHSP